MVESMAGMPGVCHTHTVGTLTTLAQGTGSGEGFRPTLSLLAAAGFNRPTGRLTGSLASFLICTQASQQASSLPALPPLHALYVGI